MEYPQSNASASTSAADPIDPPHPVPVVGPQHCCPHPVDLAIVRIVRTLADQFTVKDINSVLLDAAQNPIVTLRRKYMVCRWQAFRGDSGDPNDLIFSVKWSSVFRFDEPEFYVFLSSNTSSEHDWDFKIQRSQNGRSCDVYARESNTIAAQITVESVPSGETNFMVTVHPNVDYAFIVAQILILDRMHQDIENIKKAFLALFHNLRRHLSNR